MSSNFIALHPSKQLSGLSREHGSTDKFNVASELGIDDHLMMALYIAIGSIVLLLSQ